MAKTQPKVISEFIGKSIRKHIMFQIRECKCGKHFKIAKYSSKVYCSLECSYKFRNDIAKTGIIKQCAQCNKNIYIAKWQTSKKYCCDDCRQKGSIIITNYICKTCGKTYSLHGKFKPMRKFCSIKCSNVNRSMLAAKKRSYTNTKPELEFAALLSLNNIEYNTQQKISWKHGWWKFYDFYIPEKNILVEVDGTYWHGKNLKDNELDVRQIHTRKNDLIKNDLAIKRGYTLIRIWSDEIQTFKIEQLK